MIVSAVIDPVAFGVNGIVDNETRKEAIAFLKSIFENGVLIDKTKARSLLEEAIKEAIALNGKFGKTILILFEEIKKNWKRLVAGFGDLEQSMEDGPIQDQVAFLADRFEADAIVTTESRRIEYTNKGIPDQKVVGVSQISESTFEQLRINQVPENTLNNLTEARIEELIGRSVKYSMCLEIFDYHMCAAKNSAGKNYYPGIKKFAEIWEKYCVVGKVNPAERKLVLYAASERGMGGSKGGTNTCKQVGQMLDEEIATPLDSDLAATVVRRPKKDSGKKMHARGYVAKKRAYMLDPGFDAFKVFKPDRETLLERSVALEQHFSACRQLPGLT